MDFMNFDFSTRVGEDEKLATDGVELISGQKENQKRDERGARISRQKPGMGWGAYFSENIMSRHVQINLLF